MIRLSAIVLTKNEEANIVPCLKSLDFADEIIVVDDNSTDGTKKKIQDLGCKIYERNLNGDFAAQRNFGLTKASGEWVLFVDADEIVADALKKEISTPPDGWSSFAPVGFYIKRTDFMWGRQLKYGETGDIKLLRLAKKDAGKWKRKVHEYWDIKGQVGELKNPLIHHPHQDLKTFIEHINTFSSLHAKENLKEQKRGGLVKIVFWPKLKFLQNYILKLGFLDGTHGFVVAMLMSFHSFLAWSKQWLKD